MRIAAIMLVRNIDHIIMHSILHLLLNLKVDRILVADNDSTDSTRAILERFATFDKRLSWQKAPGGYLQSERMTDLALKANNEGYDWILPVDADEFPFLPKKQQLKNYINGINNEMIYANVVNFVQRRNVYRRTENNLKSMYFSARPIGGTRDAYDFVNNNKCSFIEMNYTRKVIFKFKEGVKILSGNHHISGNYKEGTTGKITYLHAPITCFEDMYIRLKDTMPRYSEYFKSPSEGWHVKRLSNLNIKDEWKNNSQQYGRIGLDNRKSFCRFDIRLIKIYFANRIKLKKLDYYNN